MASISSRATKRAPQQERAEKRVAAMLAAAGEVFAEAGWDAATMTAVAARSGSSIGALYNYFPDKQALAYALLREYSRTVAALFDALIARVPELTPQELAGELLEMMLGFAESHVAYLRLLEAPIRFRRDPGARKAMRVAMGEAFRVKNPQLTEEEAFLAVNVALQIVKGMMVVYGDAGVKDKAAVVAEFRAVLGLYLGRVLRG